MNTRILVAYATLSGSTVDVAQAVADTLRKQEINVDLQPISQVTECSPYHAVILGAPLILGWHRDMVGFIMDHQNELKDTPVACFTTQLNLTRVPDTAINGIPIFLDQKLAQLPARPDKLNVFEKFGTPQHCMGAVIQNSTLVKPISIGFFGGKLEYARLNLLHRLFIRLIIRGKEGDHRNWNAIQEWVEVILPQLNSAKSTNPA